MHLALPRSKKEFNSWFHQSTLTTSVSNNVERIQGDYSQSACVVFILESVGDRISDQQQLISCKMVFLTSNIIDSWLLQAEVVSHHSLQQSSTLYWAQLQKIAFHIQYSQSLVRVRYTRQISKQQLKLKYFNKHFKNAKFSGQTGQHNRANKIFWWKLK